MLLKSSEDISLNSAQEAKIIMSLPSSPDKDNLPSREEVINQIISSIAMEELGLSHIINAEGEKLQYALGTLSGVTGPEEPLTIDALLELNESIHRTLDSTMMNQFFLREKLMGALSAAVMQGPTGPTGPTGPPGMAATIDVIQPATRVPYTDNPRVYNEGTPQEAIFRFEIPAGEPGATGVTGATGPTGSTGPTALTIPFSISKYGVELCTDAQGEPLMVAFSGFGSSYRDASAYLQEGEWSTGTITIREGMYYGTAFIMPNDGVLKKIYVLFSTGWDALFSEDAAIRPFVCLAVSNSDDLVYTILQNTLTFTEPYAGGVDYPEHAVRKGSSTNLNIEIGEGTLVAIVAGIMGENVTSEQQAMFNVSGGLYLE